MKALGDKGNTGGLNCKLVFWCCSPFFFFSSSFAVGKWGRSWQKGGLPSRLIVVISSKWERKRSKAARATHDSNILIECELLSCPEPTLLYNCIKSNDGFWGEKATQRRANKSSSFKTQQWWMDAFLSFSTSSAIIKHYSFFLLASSLFQDILVFSFFKNFIFCFLFLNLLPNERTEEIYTT